MVGYRPTDWHVLDLEKDPTPGDPDRVRSLAKSLHDFADDVSDALRLVKGMAGEDAVLTMVGKTADVFRDEFSGVPKNLKKLKKSYDLAGDALAAYWPKLERAQALADRALAKGREAQADLSSAKSRLSSADSWVSRANKEADKYKDDPTGGKDVEKPDEAKVRAATRDAASAKDAHTSAQSDVTSAQTALDAAKKMAEDARKMREDAAGEAKRQLEEASDAGIQNRKWYEEVGDWFSDNWDTIVAVCKVVVAVLGIIAMIIGGPILGAIVLIAALVVLADTLNKYMKGQASLWDVAFAALDCIPGMKGLTSLGGLAKGMKALAGAGLKTMGKSLLKRAGRAREAIADGARGAYSRLKSKIKGCGDPVDVATGQMFLEQDDLTLLGILPLNFTRRYASGYRTGRWFGPSWTSTVDQRIEVDDEGLVLVTDDGMLLPYPTPGGSRTAPEIPEPRTPPGSATGRAGPLAGTPLPGPRATAHPAPADTSSSAPPGLAETADDSEYVLPQDGPAWPLRPLDGGGFVVTDPVQGLTRHFAPAVDGDAWLTKIEDRHGNSLTVERGPEGTPRGIRHSAGYHVCFGVADERITQLAVAGAEANGSDAVVRRYAYTDDGLLAEIYGESDTPLRLGYDSRERITSWTDTNDRRYAYDYDEQDRCIAQGGAAGHLANSFTYDVLDPLWPGHRVTRVTTPQGAVTRFIINDDCLVVAEIDPLGHTVHREFDDRHRLIAHTDPLGNVTRFENNPGGQPVAVTRPDGAVVRYEYTPATGQLTRIVLPDGTSWKRTYDEHGRCIQVTNPLGESTRYSYTPTGALASTTDQLGRTTRVDSDPAGLPLCVTDPRGAQARWERDAFGRVAAFTDPLGRRLRMTWSTDGHLITRTAPDGAIDTWTYDGEGNCTSHTDPLGLVSHYTYTHFDRLASSTEPAGEHLTFAYDSALRLTTVTDPLGRAWRNEYDASGRLVAHHDYDGRRTTFTRDAAGNVLTRTDAAGQQITFAYDTQGQVVRKTTPERSTRYEYDVLGRITHADDGDSRISATHDALGRLLSETVNGRTLSNTYGPAGLRQTRTTPTGAQSQWEYDAADNMARLFTAGQALEFAHDLAGNEVSRRIADSLHLAQSYDELGRLSAQTLTAGHDDPIQQRAYSYQPDGHLAAVTDQLAGTRTFDVDPAGRVSGVQGAWSEHYAYDPAGNQTEAHWPDRSRDATGSRVYEGTRLIGAGRTRYTYDRLGRTVVRSRTRLSRKPDTWHYTWDSEDRLVGVVTPNGEQWRYRYDPWGRRTAKERLSSDGTTTEERTDFVWDGTHLCEQTTWTSDGSPPVTLTWDHYGLTPIAQTERRHASVHPDPRHEPPVAQGERTTHFPAKERLDEEHRVEEPPSGDDWDQQTIDERFFAIVTDASGAPAELIEPDGDIAWRARSTLWGKTSWTADSTAYTPLRFPGQYFDPETGLHSNYFRYYDPETGRYTTLDPLGVAPDPNPYTYVRNPHSATDPLGLAACDEADVTWGGRVRYGEPGPGGRATGMKATIESDMTGGKTNPSVEVPGYEKYKKLNKTHLLGAQIGGSNKDPRNFVTMHRFANSPVMRKIEGQIREAAERGETIEYSVTPIYATNDATDVVPKGLLIEAHGNRGFEFTPYGSDSATNALTILNVPKPV
ncbi:DUF6531 domain-containing protein [Streptomyces phaeochromogenes]|uniref:DUF6531 domain-containing protein n=1 Tax=Streptomyces phaeochromogenes TaxID=1923 RepID=UPI0036C7175E